MQHPLDSATSRSPAHSSDLRGRGSFAAISALVFAASLAACSEASVTDADAPDAPDARTPDLDAAQITPDASPLPPMPPASGLYIVDRGGGIGMGRILHRDTAGTVHELVAGLDRPTSLTFGDDGYAYITAFGPEPGGVLVYDVATWQFVRWYVEGATAEFNGYVDESVRVMFRGGRGYVLSNDQNQVVVSPYPNGSRERTFGTGAMVFPHDMAFGPDGMLYIAVEDTPTTHGKIQVWDATTGQLVRSLASDFGATAIVTSLRFQPDGRLLVVDWQGNAVFRYDAVTGTRTRFTSVLAGLQHPIDIEPWVDNKWLVATDTGVVVIQPNGLRGAMLVPVADGGLREPKKLVYVP